MMDKGLRFVDVLTRHQIYLEGVKAYEWNQFNAVLSELNRELKRLFSELDYRSFDSMTKAKLTRFMSELRKVQSRIYSAYTKELIERIERFVATDRRVSKIIFATLFIEEQDEALAEVEPIESEDDADDVAAAFAFAAGMLGVAALKPTADGLGRLMAAINGAPIPANGLYMKNFIQAFANSAQASIENIVRRAYANKSTVAETLAEIVGTMQAQRRDGQLNRVFGQAGAVIDTVLQHVSSVTQSAVASSYWERYEWVSVIDGRTTDICRSRDGKVYRYGDGPLPPAHVRCRSKTVPYVGSNEPYDSFYAFAKNQPIDVQNDILGEQKAEALRRGNLKASDMPKFDTTKAISYEQFASKLSNILKR